MAMILRLQLKMAVGIDMDAYSLENLVTRVAYTNVEMLFHKGGSLKYMQ